MHPAQSSPPDILVVAGMHRSGTSAIARVLSLAGGRLPEHVMNPGPDNPLGFWEPHQMVALNDTILGSVGSRWDDVFGHRVASDVLAQAEMFEPQARQFLEDNYSQLDLAILKDPRASLAIPFWDRVLREAGGEPLYIIMVRHPLEVARSIAARSQAAEAASSLVWASYMLAVERDTRGLRRIFVDYGSLLDDWRLALKRIEDALGRPLQGEAAETAAEIDSFLSGSMRHHKADKAVLSERADLWPQLATIYAWLCAAAEGRQQDYGAMDRSREELDRVATVIEPALKDLRAECAAFPAVRSDLNDAQSESAALRTLVNQFHAEADHNGRHLRAAQGLIADLTHQLKVSRPQPAATPNDAKTSLPVWREMARAEAALLRQITRNNQLQEALDQERRLATAHAAHLGEERAQVEAVRAQLVLVQSQLQQQLAECQAQESQNAAQLAATQAQSASAAERIKTLHMENRRLIAANDRIVNGWIWRFARPLRVIEKRITGLRRPRPSA